MVYGVLGLGLFNQIFVQAEDQYGGDDCYCNNARCVCWPVERVSAHLKIGVLASWKYRHLDQFYIHRNCALMCESLPACDARFPHAEMLLVLKGPMLHWAARSRIFLLWIMNLPSIDGKQSKFT